MSSQFVNHLLAFIHLSMASRCRAACTSTHAHAVRLCNMLRCVVIAAPVYGDTLSLLRNLFYM